MDFGNQNDIYIFLENHFKETMNQTEIASNHRLIISIFNIVSLHLPNREFALYVAKYTVARFLLCELHLLNLNYDRHMSNYAYFVAHVNLIYKYIDIRNPF